MSILSPTIQGQTAENKEMFILVPAQALIQRGVFLGG